MSLHRVIQRGNKPRKSNLHSIPLKGEAVKRPSASEVDEFGLAPDVAMAIEANRAVRQVPGQQIETLGHQTTTSGSWFRMVASAWMPLARTAPRVKGRWSPGADAPGP